MGNIIPFPNNNHERAPRLSGLQRESAEKRWPIRHIAAEQGIYAFHRAYPPVSTPEQLGANVVDIATNPNYHYHAEQPATEMATPAPAPEVAQLDLANGQELDIDQIRRYIDGIAS